LSGRASLNPPYPEHRRQLFLADAA
jgi:hypothetical protein